MSNLTLRYCNIALVAVALLAYFTVPAAIPIILLACLAVGCAMVFLGRSIAPAVSEAPTDIRDQKDFDYSFLRGFTSEINKQIEIVDSDLKQLQSILCDATGSLSSTVMNVESDTGSQREALELLINELMDATSLENKATREEESSIRRYSSLAVDLDESIAAKDAMTTLSEELSGMHGMVLNQSDHIETLSHRIQQLVMEGILSLQFEDIARQLIEHINDRVAIINTFVEGLMEGYLEFSSTHTEEIRNDLKQALEARLDAAKQELQGLSKAVQQTNMQQGDVDLF